MPSCNHHIKIRINIPLPAFPINYGMKYIYMHHLLPDEKPNNTINRSIIPYRKVLNGIVYVLRTGCRWKMLLPREYGLGSTFHRRFQEWVQLDIFKKIWTRLLKEYDNRKGIKWIWRSLLDSISIKSPLVGR